MGWVKYELKMSADGCGMDSYGCGGIRGTGGQENKAIRGTDGRAVHVWYGCTLWPGKFPQKYARAGIEGVRIGAAVAAAEKIAAAADISSNSSNSNSRN